MLQMFYCSIDNDTNSDFLKLCVHVYALYSGFGKAIRDPDLGNTGVWFPPLPVCSLGKILSIPFSNAGYKHFSCPFSSTSPSKDLFRKRHIAVCTSAGKLQLSQLVLFAAWVVLPMAGVWCASLVWGIARRHGRWSPWPFWASHPKLLVPVLFVAAYFLLALQPEILSTHFGEQRALGISIAGNASCCISGRFCWC